MAKTARIPGIRITRTQTATPLQVVGEGEAFASEAGYIAHHQKPSGLEMRAAEGDSLWVGFWLPEDVAATLAIPGGEPAANLHMTLAFLGKSDELIADAKERMAAAVQMFSLAVGSVEFSLNGVARFQSDEAGGGQDVVYATVESECLEEFRWRLYLALESVGLPPRSDHGYWTPHVTLAYVDAGADVAIGTLPNVEIVLDSVTTSLGKDDTARVTYPLRPPAYQYGPSIMMTEPIKAMEPPATIPVLPVPGTYKHPVYGNIDLTPERIANFVSNFEAQAYQAKIPIDLEHETKLSGAAGWITGLVQNSDGSVNAVVDWTDRGIDMLTRDRFQYISPEWYEEWTDPATEKEYTDILIGAALCTRPFFKTLMLHESAASIAASERVPTTAPGAAVMTEAEKAAAAALAASTPPAPVVASDDIIRRLTELETSLATVTTERDAAKLMAEANASQSKSLAETVQRLERDSRRERLTAMVTGNGGESDGVRWYGEPSKHVAFLEFIADNAKDGENSEEFKDYVTQQTALGAQLKSSKILSEVGTVGAGAPSSDTALGKVRALAIKLKESDPKLSLSEAEYRVMMADPDLQAQYLDETREATGRRR